MSTYQVRIKQKSLCWCLWLLTVYIGCVFMLKEHFFLFLFLFCAFSYSFFPIWFILLFHRFAKLRWNLNKRTTNTNEMWERDHLTDLFHIQKLSFVAMCWKYFVHSSESITFYCFWFFAIFVCFLFVFLHFVLKPQKK